MIIDSHLHVWDRNRSGYDWLTGADPRLTPDHGIGEVADELDAAGVTGVVLVQADDTSADTAYMLQVADASPRVLGVVGFAPLHDPARTAELLPGLTADPRIVGLRNLTHDRPDPDWILRADVSDSLAQLATAGMPLDYVAVLPRHLANAATLAARHPELLIIIDHLAKPPIGGDQQQRQDWADGLRAAGRAPNVVAKVSGLYGSVDPAAWTADDLRWCLEVALEAFGADRLMYGGDWPVSLIAGGYTAVWQGLSAAFASLSATERDQLLFDTAARCYGLRQAQPTSTEQAGLRQAQPTSREQPTSPELVEGPPDRRGTSA